MQPWTANTAGSRSCLPTANPLVIEGVKLIPSVTRVFRKSREMYVYLQAYENNATVTEPLVVFASFLRGQSKVFETPAMAINSGLEEKSKAVPLGFSVGLDKLPAGEYNLQVAVLDPNGKKASFWQASIMIVQ
jgi:hypothetical protein